MIKRHDSLDPTLSVALQVMEPVHRFPWKPCEAEERRIRPSQHGFPPRDFSLQVQIPTYRLARSTPKSTLPSSLSQPTQYVLIAYVFLNDKNAWSARTVDGQHIKASACLYACETRQVDLR